MQNAACLQTTFGNAQHEGDTVQSSACCRRSTHLSVAPRHPRDELLEEVAGLVLAEPVGLHNSVEKLAAGGILHRNAKVGAGQEDLPTRPRAARQAHWRLQRQPLPSGVHAASCCFASTCGVAAALTADIES